MANPLPHGYGEQRLEPGVHIVARLDVLPLVAEAVREAGTLYDFALHQGPGQVEGGRGPVPLLETSTGERWAVRHCWRGGAVARVLRDRYLRFGTSRPLAELAVQAVLSARGVATPQVNAAVVYESGLWYRGDVATSFIADATDLAMLSLGSRRWSDAERERAWFAAGTMLRAFFLTGARHADLNLRNIIVRRQPIEAYLLDLDRCTQAGRSRSGAHRAMLSRFHRSRRKLERLAGEEVGQRELAAMRCEAGASQRGNSPGIRCWG